MAAFGKRQQPSAWLTWVASRREDLLRLLWKWLSCHKAIAVLLPGIPEPEHVAEVRAILRPLSEIKERAAAVRLPPPAQSSGG